jgi:hypothetical protein
VISTEMNRKLIRREFDPPANIRQHVPQHSPRHRLTEDEARAILAMKGKGTQMEVAKLFGVCQATVGSIWIGRSWSHINKKAGV